MENLKKPEEEKNALGGLYSLLHDVVYILGAIVLIFVFFIRLVRVEGSSMYETLYHHDLVALQSNVTMGDLEYGDIIVASKPSFRGGEPIVKRVIATEGQTVDIQYVNGIGVVYVDGTALEEPYILEPMRQGATGYAQVSFPLTVEEGCLFAMGDNRNGSADSRFVEIGQIPEDRVVGKVLFLVFPGTGETRGSYVYGDGRDFGRLGSVK